MIVGIVGLGRMGWAMAERLCGQSFVVAGRDQNAEANRKFAAGGLRIAASVREENPERQ
jgi:3-hydroxyisobutyrate dehydrogenase-like beta-hydroxyacid dehydrogenase